MNLENTFEQFAYGMGTTTALVTSISPVTRLTITAIKTGGRTGKAVKSFLRGGWYNPTFYVNSGSAILSGTSLASTVCPPLALPLYIGSQTCSSAADAIDNVLGIGTVFF
jgi:hypothetical protein